MDVYAKSRGDLRTFVGTTPMFDEREGIVMDAHDVLLVN
jgi:hypothetical protein